ncbi:DUF2326 domain-containing protein [Companilactobacillus zhachilii]|uniref:DUF2326 domain-containing protein n=1 Tax=Companilactobacillus zhachilii TaxID=2304606 RepID=UPI0019226671|nr:DUF2326 domain-containing protein [Companilactobacillus zhachilii]MBL3531668.1 DUF2326 domain-containing protein [Companilactobacillus zhachilii]
MNLIVDSTPLYDFDEKNPTTGNGVGKTTVLRLINFCFGKEPKSIYTDPEEKQTISYIKNHLIKGEVLIRLTLSSNPDEIDPETEYIIERNFLSRKKKILSINGDNFSNVQDFTNKLSVDLLDLKLGDKPTFRQIVSRNFRIDPPSVDNTLRYMGNFLRGPEYETLFLFLFGIKLPDRAALVKQLGTEKSFLKRLEKNPREELVLALKKNIDDIDKAQVKRSSLNVDPLYSEKLKQLDDLKYKQTLMANRLTSGRLRASLIEEAQEQVKSKKTLINEEELSALYSEAQNLLANVEISFNQLIEYNNSMVDSRSDFIGRELPSIRENNKSLEQKIDLIKNDIKKIVDDLSESNNTQELENISEELGQLFENKGRLSSRIDQIDEERVKVDDLNRQVVDIEKTLFSTETHDNIQDRLAELNRFFYFYSQSMYGEDSGVTFQVKKDRLTGKQFYDFYVFSPNNSSSGKKQGEIAAFDLGYTLFARKYNIPHLDFVLYDKKELMHGNQLLQISDDSQKANVQVIVPILTDKIPSSLDDDKLIILRLSQNEKLFKF